MPICLKPFEDGQVPVGQTISIDAAINAIDQSSITPQNIFSALKQEFIDASIQAEQIEAQIQVPLSSPRLEQPYANQNSSTTQIPIQFVKGDRVFNQKFGLGTVVAVKQYGGQVRELVIDFDFISDEKTLVATAVQLA